jgi:hypothetical protein
VNRYELAIATADFLEQNPEKYDFLRGTVPKENHVGCILGHMGRLAGMPAYTLVSDVAPHLLGMSEGRFYNSLWSAQGVKCIPTPDQADTDTWIKSAKVAVEVLRKVAESYYKAVSSARIGGWYEKKAQEFAFWDEYRDYMAGIQHGELQYRGSYIPLDVV